MNSSGLAKINICLTINTGNRLFLNIFQHFYKFNLNLK